MDCDHYLEAFSARLDGEDPGMATLALDQHLASCPRCRARAGQAMRVARATRLFPAEPVPDLTETILAAVAGRAGAVTPAHGGGVGTPSRGRRLVRALAGDGAGAPAVIRLALALVAAVQVLAALPALWGDDLGATVHVAHEQGAWGLALAAGLAFGAWSPARATAMLPFLGVFVTCLALMTALDVAAGRVALSAEVPHLVAAIGVVLLWIEMHPSPGPRYWQRPVARRGAGPGMAT